jgi:hypothetical protein
MLECYRWTSRIFDRSSILNLLYLKLKWMKTSEKQLRLLNTVNDFKLQQAMFKVSLYQTDIYGRKWQVCNTVTTATTMYNSTDTLTTWKLAGVTVTGSIKLQFTGTTVLWLVTTPTSPAISQCDVTVIAVTYVCIQSLIKKNIQFKT